MEIELRNRAVCFVFECVLEVYPLRFYWVSFPWKPGAGLCWTLSIITGFGLYERNTVRPWTLGIYLCHGGRLSDCFSCPTWYAGSGIRSYQSLDWYLCESKNAIMILITEAAPVKLQYENDVKVERDQQLSWISSNLWNGLTKGEAEKESAAKAW